MASKTEARRKYTEQREPRTPPHVSTKVLRIALKMRQRDVCDRVEEISGDRLTEGALSAIENGLRGASAELLAVLEQVYGLEPGSITTTYVPRSTPASAVSA